MVTKRIVLYHVISKDEIEVDKVKADFIVNLCPPRMEKKVLS